MQVLPILSSWLPVVAWAGLIYLLSDIPHLKSGLAGWDFFLRKGAHMAEFGILTLLLLRATRRTWTALRRDHALLASGISSLLYAITDEFHQRFVPGRGASWVDVLVDACGILAVGLLVRRTRWWDGAA